MVHRMNTIVIPPKKTLVNQVISQFSCHLGASTCNNETNTPGCGKKTPIPTPFFRSQHKLGNFRDVTVQRGFDSLILQLQNCKSFGPTQMNPLKKPHPCVVTRGIPCIPFIILPSFMGFSYMIPYLGTTNQPSI